ncbi:unnamed protein product [Lymnaea stagnalis]|uniref:Uncharacterized protein n=1 Tax=Lymnaea stagnalis TaxID=6523 RepID=A0AAV2H8S5_LYMST
MFSSDYSRCLKSLFLMTSLLTVVQCHADDDNGGQDNELPAGLGRLIFKQMRFRELPALAANTEPKYGDGVYNHWDEVRADEQIPAVKRESDKELVDRLADLLRTMRDQESSSTLRLPSLRFG